MNCWRQFTNLEMCAVFRDGPLFCDSVYLSKPQRDIVQSKLVIFYDSLLSNLFKLASRSNSVFISKIGILFLVQNALEG